MQNSDRKKRILHSAGMRMRTTMDELRERIGDLRAVTIGDDNAESASQTESTHGSDVELMNQLGEQLEHLQQELERLQAIDPAERSEHVQYGSVVLTDKRNFLVAASIEEFEVDGEHFLGVTPKAPLIQKMLGMGTGEVLEFNGTAYTIEKIF